MFSCRLKGNIVILKWQCLSSEKHPITQYNLSICTSGIVPLSETGSGRCLLYFNVLQQDRGRWLGEGPVGGE
jgi:hypothetical protein